MQYELVVVLDPKTDEKQAQDKLTTLLTKEGFAVSDVSSMGKKILAYPLNKMNEGLYLLVNFAAEGKNAQVLYNRFKTEDDILRALVLKKVEKKNKKLGTKAPN